MGESRPRRLLILSNNENDINDEVDGANKKIYLKRGESLKQSRLKAGDLVSIQNPENMNVFVFFILLLSFFILHDHHDHGCCSQGVVFIVNHNVIA